MPSIQLAVSNIAWNKADDELIYTAMQNAGFTGLELAPTRIFPEQPYDNLSSAALFGGYLRNRWGFAVPSMQSIWYGQTGSIFDDAQAEELLAYTEEAYNFAHVLNCPSLVFGCPKNRMLPEGADPAKVDAFFDKAFLTRRAAWPPGMGCVWPSRPTPPGTPTSSTVPPTPSPWSSGWTTQAWP